MKTFDVTQTLKPIEFQVGDQVYTAIAADSLPANVLIRYSEQVGEGKMYEAHKIFFARVLIGDAADEFIGRLDSTSSPITLAHMVLIAEYLIEQYAAFDPKKQLTP